MLDKTEKEIIKHWQGDMCSPLVSISCATYNHDNYIAEALDSFLAQETNFPFEIIIGEDCSTDTTLKIITHYKTKYPTIIKVVAWSKNVGAKKNWLTILQACKGKYIANCEGDDCWIDNLKLQRQIDFLEANPDYSMSCHTSENYNDATKRVIQLFPNIKKEKDFSLDDLLKSNIANTCTVVYRKLNIDILNILNKLPIGDWPLNILYAEYGKIKFFPKNMARYRIHSGGVWSSVSRLKQLNTSILILEEMNIYFENKYLTQINNSIAKLTLEKALYYVQINEPIQAHHYYHKAHKYGKLGLRMKTKYLMKKYLLFFYDILINLYLKIRYF